MYLQNNYNNTIKLDKRITIISGNFGSGKTEIAVNYAINLSKQIDNLHIADLDVVNPYFRCREAKKQMEEYGIKVIIPNLQYFYADLPIIIPEIKGLFENPENKAIIDVGGDKVGARVLPSFGKSIANNDYDLFFVVNKNRPFTDTIDGCKNIISEIENESKLKITGLIGNTHLIDETTPETIYDGYEFTKELSQTLNIPIKFIGAIDEVYDILDKSKIKDNVLRLKRLMLPPWLKGVDLLGITNINPALQKIKGA